MPQYIDLEPLLGQYGKEGMIEILALSNLDSQTPSVISDILMKQFALPSTTPGEKASIRVAIMTLRFQAVETLLWFLGASWFKDNILKYQAGPGGKTQTIHNIAKALADEKLPCLLESRWGSAQADSWREWVWCAIFSNHGPEQDDGFFVALTDWVRRIAISYLDRSAYNAIKHGGRIGRDFVLPSFAKSAWEEFESFEEPLAFVSVGRAPQSSQESYLFRCENGSSTTSNLWTGICCDLTSMIVSLRLAAVQHSGNLKIEFSIPKNQLDCELPGDAFMFTIGIAD